MSRRPSRTPDFAAEARAFTELVEVFAHSPGEEGTSGENDRVLQSLVETARTLCRAGSCGISVLEKKDGRDIFRCPAVAGNWAGFLNSLMPRESCPCGAALDRDTPLLLDHPQRDDPLPPLDPPVAEALLVPFHRAGTPVGTLWVVAHDETRRFDAEDLRLLTNLSRFAALVHRLIDPQQQRLEYELAAMQRLHNLVLRLLACKDQQTALQEILLASMQLTSAEMGNVQLFDPATNTLGIVVQHGFNQEFLDHFRQVRNGEPTACGRAITQRQRIVVEDIGQDPAFASHLAMAERCRWRAVQSTPLICHSGKVLGVLSTHYRRPFHPSPMQLRLLDLYARQAADWIERQQAEEVLRLHKEKFEALLDHAPLGMYLVDADLRIRHANPIALAAFGDIPGGVIDRQLDEVVRICWLPDFADEIVRVFRHTLETGEPYQSPERAERRADSGVMEYYKVRVERIKLSDGQNGAVCYFDDVSASIEARVAIGESEQRYRTLFESIAEGFCVVQMLYDDADRPIDYRFLEYNPAFERHTGLADALGKTARQMIPGLEKHWVEIYATIAETGEPAHFVEHSAYMQRWFQVDAFRVGDPEERKVAILFADITEQKQAEEVLHVVNEELRRANLALRETDRRKDEFLAMLAHELRNPLAPIQSATDLLKLDTPPETAAAGSLEIIQRQVGHLVRLIDDLLDVSRITRGKIDLRKERTDLVAIVGETLRSLRQSAEHELSVSLPDEPIFLEVDPVRLNQVIANLLNNAVKYTPPGGRIWLVVEVEQSEAVIRIKDTGLGIPPDKLEEVFEVFTQLNRSLERTQSGLGIGLTLVKRLVEMHGGSVRAYSEGIDRGSEFVVRLPLATDTKRNVPPDATASPSRAESCRILVADDNRDLVLGLKRLFDAGGHLVRVAHDGREALQVAADFQPDVILLDIGMPLLNGFEVCRAIRQEPWGREITIAALTGWGQDADRRQSIDAGFDLHLVKPVNHAVLEMLLAGARK